MGIGASCLWFLKTATANDTEQLVAFLCDIYPLDDDTSAFFRGFIATHNHLVLPYSEAPEEYLGFYEDTP